MSFGHHQRTRHERVARSTVNCGIVCRFDDAPCYSFISYLALRTPCAAAVTGNRGGKLRSVLAVRSIAPCCNATNSFAGKPAAAAAEARATGGASCASSPRGNVAK